jgi:hypothetical protein
MHVAEMGRRDGARSMGKVLSHVTTSQDGGVAGPDDATAA